MAVVVVAYETSKGAAGATILGIGGGYAPQSATKFSSALIMLGSNVR